MITSIRRESSTLAERESLTVYDACYLKLAIRKGIPIATKDKEILLAAKRLGVEIIDV